MIEFLKKFRVQTIVIILFVAIGFLLVRTLSKVFGPKTQPEPKVITDNKEYGQDSIILQSIQKELHRINSAIEEENRRRLQMVIEQDKVLQQLKIQNEIIRQKIQVNNKRIDSLDAIGQFNEMSRYIGF